MRSNASFERGTVLSAMAMAVETVVDGVEVSKSSMDKNSPEEYEYWLQGREENAHSEKWSQ